MMLYSESIVKSLEAHSAKGRGTVMFVAAQAVVTEPAATGYDQTM